MAPIPPPIPLPSLVSRGDGGRLLVWRARTPWLAISSAALGGGIGLRRWIINATVPIDYDRPDPGAHLAQMAAEFALSGPGVGLMTAVDVAGYVVAADDGVRVAATVGLGQPEWAAAPEADRLLPLAADAGHADLDAPPRPGTVNIVAFVPVRLADAALVNAVTTVAEAKTQALWELGVNATGTASDAVCVACPPDGPAVGYGGPRSFWGARLARAVRAAVVDGGRHTA